MPKLSERSHYTKNEQQKKDLQEIAKSIDNINRQNVINQNKLKIGGNGIRKLGSLAIINEDQQETNGEEETIDSSNVGSK